jgi:hypothetical protein
MNRSARVIILLSAVFVPIFWMTGDGRAADEPPVVRALLDSAAISASARPTYEGLEVDADGTITLTDFRTQFEAEDDPDTSVSFEVASLVLSDVTEIAAGVFEVGTAEWSRTTVTAAGESAAAIPLMTARSLYVYQPGDEPTAIERIRTSNVLAKEFAMPEALVLVAGQSVVIEGVNGTWDGDPKTGAGTSHFSAQRIHIPGAVFEGEDNPLAMAGYSEIELAVEGSSVTSYSDEAIGFEMDMRIDGRDVGSLIIELAADGIPLALFAEIDAETDPDALLGFAEGVSLQRARIRFEDDSLTTRILSLMAEAEGTDVASFVAEGTEGLDAVLAESLDPDLARQVAAALIAYLNDPRSITVAVAPTQPIQFAQVMAGLENPAALIELLQLSITAND